MSLLLEYIENNPKKLSLIGIDYEKLQQLFTQAEALHYEKQAEIEAAKFRLNSKGAGCKPKLSLGANAFNFSLFIPASYLSMGVQFGVSESTANNFFHYWLDILQSCCQLVC